VTAASAASNLVVQAPEIGTPQLKELAKLAGAREIVAIPGGETQAFRLVDAANAVEVARYCAQAGFDFGFVPREQRIERVQLVAMDMDSTLITIECVDEIAALMGIKPEIAGITASAMRGEIDFAESLTRRVALLAGTKTSGLERVYDERLRLSPGAERMLSGFSSPIRSRLRKASSRGVSWATSSTAQPRRIVSPASQASLPGGTR
jgi:phosphoserine phosphatase